MRLTYLGTATLLIEIDGLRLLTDPALDPAGAEYAMEPMPGVTISSRKLTGPALTAEELGRIDAVLLSHDEHFDNLDDSGRAFLPQAGVTVTTPGGAGRLGGNARGLAPWESLAVDGVRVTAVPARHGPDGSEPVVGHVTGFVLEWEGQRHGALYVSGDTVLFDGTLEVGEVAEATLGQRALWLVPGQTTTLEV